MTAQQLRNSILQQAIQGRLVPQDPNDEPASVLLERIRKEKEQLVKEGKLKKKDLVTTPIADDEEPFDIPSGWEWARLGDCMDVRDGTHDTPKYTPSGIPLVTSKNLKNGRIDLSEVKFISKEDSDSINLRSNVDNEDILFAMIGSIGNPVLVKKEYEFSIKNMALFKKVGRFLFMPYIWHMLFFLQNDMRAYASGAVQSFVSLSYLRNYPIPLPPLAEQRRIVAKIEELMPLVEKYGKTQTELDTLNQDLPRRLRQSVLQQAIQGKLVEQDEKDEPSIDVMNLLLSAKKNSGQKKLTFGEAVTEDEIPFDIPSTWSWIRLGDIVYNQTGLAYSKGDLEKKVSNPVRVLRGGNIQNGAWRTKVDDVMIAPEFVKKDIFLKKNTFITPAVTSLEHLGKTALIKEDHPDIVAGGFVLYLIPYYRDCDTFVEYLSYFFQSGFYNKFCKTITNKSGQAFWNISRQKLMDLPIPLPPLAEQRRIVAKIEELFAEIDKLK